jgi:hypothetical protein
MVILILASFVTVGIMLMKQGLDLTMEGPSLYRMLKADTVLTGLLMTPF